MRVQVTDAQLRSWRMKGYSCERIARACNLSTSQISHRIRQIWHDCQEAAALAVDPQPDEIRRVCEEIQRNWSASERERRQVGRARRWTPVAVPDSVLALVRD